LELEDLLQERPIEKIIKLATGGKGTDFEPALSFAGEGGGLVSQQA
jgi:hypothetical protein